MANSIFTEVINFLQNHSDGQKVVEESNLPASDVRKVTQEVVPKITEQVRKHPRTLEDLFEIIEQNKDDPQSMLNSKPGFNQKQAQNEGNQILQALFGGGTKASQVANDVSQRTGVSIIDISSMMPMIAAMATKMLSGKVESVTQGSSSGNRQNPVNEVLSFLDANQDGSIDDDLARIGQQILGNLFKGNK